MLFIPSEIEMALSTSYLPICACGKLPGLPYILEHCNVVIYTLDVEEL